MENIKSKWIAEIRQHLPHVPIILVGTQLDLRTTEYDSHSRNDHNRYVSGVQGENLKNSIQAYKYIECSSLMSHNIEYLFETCIESFVDKKRRAEERSKQWYHYMLPCIK